MMLYLESNTRPDISFAVHQCFWFTHNTKASHETSLKSIFWYIKDTKGNGLLLNLSNRIVVDCYIDAYFAGLWGNENPQYPICDNSRVGFVVTFANFLLLWVSKFWTGYPAYPRINLEYPQSVDWRQQ